MCARSQVFQMILTCKTVRFALFLLFSCRTVILCMFMYACVFMCVFVCILSPISGLLISPLEFICIRIWRLNRRRQLKHFVKIRKLRIHMHSLDNMWFVYVCAYAGVCVSYSLLLKSPSEKNS